MERFSEGLNSLNLQPIIEVEQQEIKGGRCWDDKRSHRPGSGTTSFSSIKNTIRETFGYIFS